MRTWVLVAALVGGAACQQETRPAASADAAAQAAPKSALPALRPLDDAHGDDFERAFDEAKDRPRYIVALSPT